MPPIPPLTNDLALRLERHIGHGVILDPDGAFYARFGDTICSKAKGGRPRNKIFCFSEADLSVVDRIIGYYRPDKLEPTFYLSPMGFSKEVARVLSNRGFAQQEFEQAILYGVPDPRPPQLPDGMTLQPVEELTIQTWAQTMAAGHEWDPGWRDDAVRHECARLGTPAPAYSPQSHRFIAYLDGQPAGVCGLTVRDGIASLGTAGVIPSFRRRGVHLAMLRHRLHLAAQLGAELVLGAAGLGNASFRNQQRVGLQIAYIEAAWQRRH